MISSRPAFKVLIFEDNPDDIFLIEQAFCECGYPCQLTVAASHGETLQILATQPFDLLLSDFGTVPPQAQDFLHSVRQDFPIMPIVIFSGSNDPDIAYKCGANAFVRKESDLGGLFAKIRGIMHFWIEVAELPSERLSKHLNNR